MHFFEKLRDFPSLIQTFLWWIFQEKFRNSRQENWKANEKDSELKEMKPSSILVFYHFRCQIKKLTSHPQVQCVKKKLMFHGSMADLSTGAETSVNPHRRWGRGTWSILKRMRIRSLCRRKTVFFCLQFPFFLLSPFLFLLSNQSQPPQSK